MKQGITILFLASVLLLGGAAFATEEAATPAAAESYEALLAEGKSEVEAMQAALGEVDCKAEQFTTVVLRAATDSGDPGGVAATVVNMLTVVGRTDCIYGVMDAILVQTTSTEQATQVAAQAMNAVSGEGEEADAIRQSIVNSALANNVDPAQLLAATAAIGETDQPDQPSLPGPPPGIGGGGPGSGSGGGGGVGSLG